MSPVLCVLEICDRFLRGKSVPSDVTWGDRSAVANARAPLPTSRSSRIRRRLILLFSMWSLTLLTWDTVTTPRTPRTSSVFYLRQEVRHQILTPTSNLLGVKIWRRISKGCQHPHQVQPYVSTLTSMTLLCLHTHTLTPDGDPSHSQTSRHISTCLWKWIASGRGLALFNIINNKIFVFLHETMTSIHVSTDCPRSNTKYLSRVSLWGGGVDLDKILTDLVIVFPQCRTWWWSLIHSLPVSIYDKLNHLGWKCIRSSCDPLVLLLFFCTFLCVY